MSKKLNYDELYIEYGDHVYQTALKYSGNSKEIAEDVSQDIFIELYTNVDMMQIRNMKNWLYTTVKNRTLNENKVRGRLVMESAMEDPDTVFPKEMDLEMKYLEKEEKEEEFDFVQDILNTLKEKNPRWYTAVYNCYYVKLPREVVASEMGISIGVLDSLLQRAKTWVKKEFGVTFKETRQD